MHADLIKTNYAYTCYIGFITEKGVKGMFLDKLLSFLTKILFFTTAVKEKGSFPKPLTAEQESKYLALAKQGDKRAKDILITHNLRLVAHITKKYQGAYETDDLISVGSIGLIKAINTYEEGKGTKGIR